MTCQEPHGYRTPPAESATSTDIVATTSAAIPAWSIAGRAPGGRA